MSLSYQFAEVLEGFADQCIPKDAPPNQVGAMRASFISGAWAMHMLHVYGMPEDDEEAQKYLTALHNEIVEHMKGIGQDPEQQPGSPKSH